MAEQKPVPRSAFLPPPSSLPLSNARHHCRVQTSRKGSRPLQRAHMRRVRASASASPPSGMSYAGAGVDIDLEGASVRALIGALGSGAKPRQSGSRGSLVDHAGGFSGLIEFGDRLLALCTDGVGSKLMLCAELGHYESVALDVMAMNVNDLLCIGAEPLAFVDYIAAPQPSPEIWAALGRSLGKACEVAKVSLCGGETATLPDMVNEIDMSGTALGWLPRGDQIDGKRVVSGDVIIGLPASGVHSNGFSLARKVLERSGLSLTSPAPFEVSAELRAGGNIWRHTNLDMESSSVTLGEVLLNPTQIYVDPLVDLFQTTRESPESSPGPYTSIHGLAHITGGGLSNLLRLNKGVGFDISSPLPVLPEFQWMQAAGSISNREMYRTFNMGMGMAVVVDATVATGMEAWLSKRLPGSKIVGTVNSSGRVTHMLPDVHFDEY